MTGGPVRRDDPSAERVQPLLRTHAVGRRLLHLAACGSTNDEAAREGRGGAPHGTVVVADAQTGGRGRLGRSWWSPPGESLYASFVLRPPLAASAAPPLTLAAGVAVVETVRQTGVRAALKWPNDVVVPPDDAAPGFGSKLAGILTEMSCGPAPPDRLDFVVVGIGLNVHNRSFPREIAETATSLALAGATGLDRAVLLAVLCERVEWWCDRLVEGGVAEVAAAWRKHGDPVGRRMRVSVAGRAVVGIARGVDDEGALLLDADDGHHYRVLSGEVLG